MRKHLTLLSLAVAVAAVGCGRPPGHVEPQFQPFLDTFNTEAKARGVSVDTSPISVVAVSELDPAAGPSAISYSKNGVDPVIQIKNDLWDLLSPVYQEAVLMHELGHCALNYGHTTNYPEIMFQNILDVGTYTRNRTELLDRFFKNGGA